jgi:hypothetical protein
MPERARSVPCTVRFWPTAIDDTVEITPLTFRFPIVLISLPTIKVDRKEADPPTVKLPNVEKCPPTVRLDTVLTGPMRRVDPCTCKDVPTAIEESVEIVLPTVRTFMTERFSKAKIFLPNLAVSFTTRLPFTDRFEPIYTFWSVLIFPATNNVLSLV